MVSHSRPRVYACVRDLHGTVQPLSTPRSQCIYYYNYVRCGLFYDSFDDLRRLHAGLCHHTRHERADLMDLRCPVRLSAVLTYDMPCDKEIIDRARTEGIRRDIAVAKPHYQDRLLIVLDLRQNTFELSGQFLRYLPVIILVALLQCRRLQRNVRPHRFSHTLCRIFARDHDLGNVDVVHNIVLIDRNPPHLSRSLLPDALCRLQRQVRPNLKLLHDDTSCSISVLL